MASITTSYKDQASIRASGEYVLIPRSQTLPATNSIDDKDQACRALRIPKTFLLQSDNGNLRELGEGWKAPD